MAPNNLSKAGVALAFWFFLLSTFVFGGRWIGKGNFYELFVCCSIFTTILVLVRCVYFNAPLIAIGMAILAVVLTLLMLKYALANNVGTGFGILFLPPLLMFFAAFIWDLAAYFSRRKR